MKINTPIIDEEYKIKEGVNIVSKTDLRGVITYANDEFIEASGFEREELIGTSHNIVRHPDMPQWAFDSLWKTIREGNPWRGVVKNRRKDGRFYWVEATVVPIKKDDQIMGYMSVRRNVSEEQVKEAIALYENGPTSNLLRTVWNKMGNNISIRFGFLAGSAFVIAALLVGAWMGISGLSSSSDTVSRLHDTGIAGVASSIRTEMELHDLHLYAESYISPRTVVAGEDVYGKSVAIKQLRNRVEDNFAKIKVLNASYSEIQKSDLYGTDIPLTENVVNNDEVVLTAYKSFKDFSEIVLIPLESGMVSKAMHERSDNLYAKAANDAKKMTAFFEKAATAQKNAQVARNNAIEHIAIYGVSFAIIMVVIFGYVFFLGIVTPLESAMRNFDRIAQGDLTGRVDIDGPGETGCLVRSSAIMQLNLSVIMDEVMLAARHVYENIDTLNRSLYAMADSAEEQHECVHRARESVEVSSGDAGSVSHRADKALARLSEYAAQATGSEKLMATLLEDVVSDVAGAMRLQVFSSEDVLAKINQVSSLVVDGRSETQMAYAASEHLKTAADYLKNMVGYFETNHE